MRAEGGDEDVAALLQPDTGADEGHPDEGVGGRLLDPGDRPAEGIAGEHLHRDRADHVQDQRDSEGALDGADALDQAHVARQHAATASGSVPIGRWTTPRPSPSWRRLPWRAPGSAPCRWT